jgi:hypothetical protein
MAAHDKNAGSSSRPAAHFAREDQQAARPRVAPSRTGAPESQRAPPHQADPPRQSEERPAPVRQLFDGSDCPDSDSLQRRRSRARSTDSASTLSVPQEDISSTAPGACNHYLSGAVEPRMFTYPSSLAGGKGQSRPTEVGGSALE